MEKILLIINKQNPNELSIDFGCKIAALNQSKLTGIFLDNMSFTVGDENSPFFLETAIVSSNINIVATETVQAIKLFEQACLHHGVVGKICEYTNDLAKLVVFQSRFADLLIIDPEIGLFDTDVKLPSPFAKEILAKAECPVILSPQKFEDVSEIVFCYDGSASSVFAIKQFTYLFPQYRYKNALLLEVNTSETLIYKEDHTLIKEWLISNYNMVYHQILNGEVEDELVNFFLLKRKKMIVMGAYGRSMLSSFFKKSSADILIRMLDVPIFVTHH